MTISDWINASLAAMSFVLAVISLGSVIASIRQNNKMLESSTRPYIVPMYETVTLPRSEIARYVVIKNCGHSLATITDVLISGPQSTLFEQQIQGLKGATLGPGQKCFYYFGPNNDEEPEILQITLTYKSDIEKEYNESTTLKMITGTLKRRGMEDESIPLSLQEIADRLL